MAESYPMDTGYSWFVLASSFLISMIILGQVLNFGIYFVVFLDYFGSSRKLTSLPGALCYALMCSAGPLAGVLQKRFGARLVITSGATLASAGLALSYFANEIWHLCLTYGCLCGIGYGLCITPSLGILPQYFEKYKYFVTSFTAVGASLGNFIFAPLSLYLIETYNWRGSMLIQAGLTLQIVVAGFICKSRVIYRQTTLGSLFDIGLLKDRRFLLFLVDGVVIGGTSFTVFSMINSLVIGRGLSTWESAELVSICGLSNMAARIIASIISPMKCTDRLAFYSIVSLLAAAGIFGCIFCTDFWSFAVAMIAFGFSMGAKFCLPLNVIIDLFGVDKVITGIGYFMFSIGFGGFSLPLVAGWFADQSGTENAFTFTSITCLVGFFFLCVLMFLRNRTGQAENMRIESYNQDGSVELRRLSRAISID